MNAGEELFGYLLALAALIAGIAFVLAVLMEVTRDLIWILRR